MSGAPDRPTGAFALCASFVRGLPREAWMAAALSAVVHILPTWLAQLATPDGWTFTGVWSVSPDVMQYRVWMNQTLAEGIVVRDLLTSEPNRPFLPVALYWSIGQVSRWTGAAPEFAYQYAGSVFAGALTLLVFGSVRHFLSDVSAFGRRVVFWVTMFGGGLGGYIRLLEHVPFLYQIDTVRRLFVDPTFVVPIFEDYRQHYLVTVLFDTHFLFIWLLALLAVLALYAGLQRGGPVWALVTGGLWALTALVHVYTGVTLTVVALCVAFLYHWKGLWQRRMLIHIGSAAAAVGLVTLWMLLLQRGSGLPMPAWTEPVIALSTVLLAYPLQLAVLAWGLVRLWSRADQDDVFLLGWVLGCLILTLSTPFYPYPSRGTVTLMIPLTALAGLGYFRHSEGLSRTAIAVMLLLTVSTGAWRFRGAWTQGTFRADRTYQYLDSEHMRATKALAEVTAVDDLFLSTPEDALWLAPYHVGSNYAAHFFLTVRFDQKRAEVEAFLDMDAARATAFLAERNVDLFWVDRQRDPQRFRDVIGADVVVDTEAGVLFRFESD